jgi:hypothetical protein
VHPAHRDAGLRRVRTTTRLLAVGSFAVAGVLSLLVARDHPGASRPHVAAGSSAAATRPTGAHTETTTSPTPAAGLTPAPAPTATTQKPVTSSGAS